MAKPGQESLKKASKPVGIQRNDFWRKGLKMLLDVLGAKVVFGKFTSGAGRSAAPDKTVKRPQQTTSTVIEASGSITNNSQQIEPIGVTRPLTADVPLRTAWSRTDTSDQREMTGKPADSLTSLGVRDRPLTDQELADHIQKYLAPLLPAGSAKDMDRTDEQDELRTSPASRVEPEDVPLFERWRRATPMDVTEAKVDPELSPALERRLQPDSMGL